MDREAWQATVHGVTKSQTGLSDLGCTCMQNQEVWRWSHKESDRTERLRMHMYAKPGGVEVEPYTPGYPLPPSPWQRSPPGSLRGLVGRDRVPESVYSSGQTSNWTAFQTF